MAIPTKGLTNIRALSGRVDQVSLPYRSYMQITCLEMEKARRNMERKSASERIALIDARLEQIEKTKQELLQAVTTSGQGGAGRDLKPAARRSAGGFKIRYLGNKTMLTVRAAAHMPTNRHRRSFRLCPSSTGASPARVGVSRLLREWRRLLNAESRRLWLEIRWRSHLQQVRSMRVRRSYERR